MSVTEFLITAGLVVWLAMWITKRPKERERYPMEKPD